VAWIIAGAAVVLGLLALLPFAVFPVEMLANLRPQIGALCLLLALAAFGVGRYSMAGVLALLGVALFASAPALFARPEPKLRDPTLTVVWANIFKDPQAAARLARLAQRQDADVVIVGEPLRDLPRLQTLLAAYPHRFGDEQQRHGAMIFSRTAFTEKALSGPFKGGDYPTVSATLMTSRGPLRLVALHPAVSGSPERLRSRDTQILASARQAEAAGRALMVGDLNATPWTTALRQVRQQTTLRRLSAGSASTWFSPFPVLGLPIDHALVTSGLEASVRVGPAVGSDHMPLIVHLR
jgi:endonuclease/exonuclease/phosphatase (EEP) superfamily protein YafD